MKKIVGGLALAGLLAALAGLVLRRRASEPWDPERPDGDWGQRQSNLS